ncbi:hypothetical protein D3C74_298900 [compost metagenome]
MTVGWRPAAFQVTTGVPVVKVVRVCDVLSVSDASWAAGVPSETVTVPRPDVVTSVSDSGASSPVVKDGGASSSPVPHAEGSGPISKSSVVPPTRSECLIDVEVWASPSTVSDWT